jgi:hypothetical protein
LDCSDQLNCLSDYAFRGGVDVSPPSALRGASACSRLGMKFYFPQETAPPRL